MLVSMQADYAIRVMVDVAQHEHTGAPVTTKDIAERQHIPRVFLTKIVAQLAAAKLLTTHRGKHGGVNLGASPDQISLLQVIETFEGHLMFNQCVADPDFCINSPGCTMRVIWHDAEDHLTEFFRTRTIGYILQRMREGNAAMSHRESELLARMSKVNQLPVQQ